jgi:hypothetical protein
MNDQQPHIVQEDFRFAIRSAAAMVFVAAMLGWLFTGTGCNGGDTSPSSPVGSPHTDFCDGFPFGLPVLAAPILTLIIGLFATTSRSTATAFVAVGLGMSLALAPLAIEINLSWDCPSGQQEAGGHCYP